MKTVTEITNEVEDKDWYATYNSLKRWSEDIVDQCALKAQIMIDKREYGGQQQVSLTWYEVDEKESIHVDRESIEKVKEML